MTTSSTRARSHRRAGAATTATVASASAHGVLAHRGQVDRAHPRQRAVVVADDGESPGTPHACAKHAVAQADRAPVVEARPPLWGGRQERARAAARQPGRRPPRWPHRAPRRRPRRRPCRRIAPRYPVRRAARDAAAGPVDVGDPPVPEPHEVVDGELEALVVRRPNPGHPRGALARPTTTTGHRRGECVEVCDRHMRAPARPAPRTGSRAASRPPGPRRAAGDGRQHEVETPVGGLVVERLHQLGVERARDVEQHAQQVRAVPGQQACGAVGPVAELAGGGAHGIRGRRTRSGPPAQHQRGGRRGDARAPRHVDQPRSPGCRAAGAHVSLLPPYLTVCPDKGLTDPHRSTTIP